MTQRMLAVSTLVGLLGSTNVALAGHVDTVAVDPISVSGCGTQSLTFSGTGHYSAPVQHLVVTLDGTELLHSHDEPEAWSTGAVSVTPGSHTLTATIYDKKAGDGHKDVEAEDTESFTVPVCDTAGGDGAAPSGPADEGDCCPGKDEAAPSVGAAKTTGKVKGAAISKLPLKLKWLNETFRKVYGRNPTMAEWTYWAGRLLSNKPTYPALYGAMQWHNAHGHTMH